MASNKEQYLREADKISEEVKNLMFGEHPWKEKKCSANVKVHSMPSKHPPIKVFRGEAIIPIKAHKLLDMVHPTEKYRFMWDPNPESATLLEELNNNTYIVYQKMKSHLLGLLSGRDSIDIFRMEETDQYLCSMLGSTEYGNGPSDPKCIRGWSYPSAIFLFPVENSTDAANSNATKVVTFFQADARLGAVPPAVLHAAMPTFTQQYFDALRSTDKIEWKAPLTNVPGRRK